MGYTKHKGLSASRIQKLMSMNPEEKIRVYTRQAPEACRRAQKLGYFTGSHLEQQDNSDFLYQYDWMRKRMADCMPEFSGDLPMWAWPVRQNERKYVSVWDPKDRKNQSPLPRIIAMVPRKRVLLSCYELWHCHLNNWAISMSESEQDAYDNKWPTYKEPGVHAEYQMDTERNWNVVFDIHLPRCDYLVENFGRVDIIQACVDRIYLDEVVSIRWLE